MKLVKYQSAWCQSCKTQTSLLNTIDLGDIILEQIDIDNLDMQQLSKVKVHGIPTLILYDNQGNEIKRKTGALTKKQLEDFLGLDN
jgi:thiol:disulfide interchange protein